MYKCDSHHISNGIPLPYSYLIVVITPLMSPTRRRPISLNGCIGINALNWLPHSDLKRLSVSRINRSNLNIRWRGPGMKSFESQWIRMWQTVKITKNTTSQCANAFLTVNKDGRRMTIFTIYRIQWLNFTYLHSHFFSVVVSTPGESKQWRNSKS